MSIHCWKHFPIFKINIRNIISCCPDSWGHCDNRSSNLVLRAFMWRPFAMILFGFLGFVSSDPYSSRWLSAVIPLCWSHTDCRSKPFLLTFCCLQYFNSCGLKWMNLTGLRKKIIRNTGSYPVRNTIWLSDLMLLWRDMLTL